MKFSDPRLERERRTIEAMIHCYCRGVHQSQPPPPSASYALCADCQELLDYATRRLERCPFAQNKPTCVKCPIHCYQAERRDQVKAVMRHAGPRMLWRHPLLALRHMLDAYRKIPNSAHRSQGNQE